MKKEIRKIMSDLFRLPENEVTEEVTMNNTESWDSLKHMELIAAIEEKFDVLVSADEIVSMTSFVKVRQILNEKKGVS